MKGGTALNLFVQDLPRLSVDIDVVFTDYTLGREEALRAIGDDLLASKSLISKMGYRASLPTSKSGDDVKLLVEAPDARVKVEVNFVFRGTVLPTVRARLCDRHSMYSPPTLKCRCSRRTSSTEANWSLRWIVNIRATCSTL
jgi:hypothetical protein